MEDIARVDTDVQEAQSAYHANGRPAVGINVQRGEHGNILDTIEKVVAILPELQRTYPGINFSIPDTQFDIIKSAINNMLQSLGESVLLTVFIVFLFLADWRAMMLAGISIPFTFLLTFGVMRLAGIEFNLITLAGVVVAVGMLIDNAVVVIENIERHYHDEGRDARTSAIGGTEEVMLAIFSGTYSTVIVLVPIIFTAGFIGRFLSPLAVTLSIALLASYVVSVTVIPLLAPWILRRTGPRGHSLVERLMLLFDARIVDPLRRFFVAATTVGLRHRKLVLVTALLLLAASLAQMPLLGRNTLPPMDTGIIRVTFEVDANTSLAGAEAIMSRIEQVILARPEVTSISSSLGSEPAALSFGGGRTPQQGSIVVHLADRFSRAASIWDMEALIRKAFGKIAGVKSVDVSEASATPLTTIAAPVDVMISGPDPIVLDRLAKEVEQRLRSKVRGLVSVSRTWSLDSLERCFVADPEKLVLHGVSPSALSGQLLGAVRGVSGSLYRIPNQDGIPLWVQMNASERKVIDQLESFPVITPRGPVPLSEFGRFENQRVAAATTRQNLSPSINVLAFREKRSIMHIQKDVEAALKSFSLPPGYRLSQKGEIVLMNEVFSSMAAALAISIVLLYFSLVPTFRSWLQPLTIMCAIPLAMIGAAWAMLIADKQMCGPAFMGLILLAGVVVNNSILLIDFAEASRKRGKATGEALIDAVKIRTRPILMTTITTCVAMVLIAAERAIGLERISPLAVVAIGGLMVSTFLTMVFVPALYSLLESAKRRARRPG